MNVTVYLGSSSGEDPAFAECARELGRLIARGGHRLVYGGSGDGLMGVLADAVLSEGGEVTGIMPRFLIARGRAHPALKDLAAVDTMAERKAEMARLGDVFVALPGGPGTLEEISEMISAARLGLHGRPCILLNVKGFYDPLKQLFERMRESGFVREDELRHLYFVHSPREAADIIRGI